MVLIPNGPDGIEVHQLRCGQDIANGKDTVSYMASQMANFVYVVVDARKGSDRSAVIVDGCWDVDGIMRHCQDNLNVKRVAAAVYTHRHFDHTGGRLPKQMTGGKSLQVPGLHTFLEQGVPVAVGKDDVEAVAKQSGVPAAAIQALNDGDTIPLGDGACTLRVLHTPGHTTGGVCFQAGHEATGGGVLITGDTLFIGACGRYDMPESDLKGLLASLDRLSKLPRETLVLPGHDYASTQQSTIGAEHDTNDMMIQAIGLVKSGRIAPSAVAASLPLPDYLGVAQRLAAKLQDDDFDESSFSCVCCLVDKAIQEEDGMCLCGSQREWFLPALGGTGDDTRRNGTQWSQPRSRL